MQKQVADYASSNESVFRSTTAPSPACTQDTPISEYSPLPEEGVCLLLLYCVTPRLKPHLVPGCSSAQAAWLD